MAELVQPVCLTPSRVFINSLEATHLMPRGSQDDGAQAIQQTVLRVGEPLREDAAIAVQDPFERPAMPSARGERTVENDP